MPNKILFDRLADGALLKFLPSPISLNQFAGMRYKPKKRKAFDAACAEWLTQLGESNRLAIVRAVCPDSEQYKQLQQGKSALSLEVKFYWFNRFLTHHKSPLYMKKLDLSNHIKAPEDFISREILQVDDCYFKPISMSAVHTWSSRNFLNCVIRQPRELPTASDYTIEESKIKSC